MDCCFKFLDDVPFYYLLLFKLRGNIYIYPIKLGTPACSHIQCPDFIGFSLGAMTVLMLHFFYLEDIYIFQYTYIHVDLAPGFCEESAGIMLRKVSCT